jgi:hypothetical protein
MLLSPTDAAVKSRAAGLLVRRRADLRISQDQRSWPRHASQAAPEPPTGGLVPTVQGKSPWDDLFGSRVLRNYNACEDA